MAEPKSVIIIGGGPAGLTAAIYTSRADITTTVIEGPEVGGQLMGTTEVENFPGFKDGITGPALIQEMHAQAAHFGTQFIHGTVDRVDFSDADNLKMWIGEKEMTAQAVIIATGASARWLNLGKGEEKFWGKGYSACATCDGAFFRGKIVAVVGGGDSACEEATFLTRFAEKVYLIHRRKEFRASQPLQKRVFDNSKIEVLWPYAVTDLIGENKLEGANLKNLETDEVKKLEIQGLFVAIGHTPNTKFLGDQIKTDEKGFIAPQNNTSTHTNIPSVFVAGDVSDYRYQQAITAAGAGCMAALDAEHYLQQKE